VGVKIRNLRNPPKFAKSSVY